MLRRTLLALGLSVATAIPAAAAASNSTTPAKPVFPKLGAFPRMGVPAIAAGSKQNLLVGNKPQTQMPLAYYPGMSSDDYKTMLAKLIAWKRWKMGYFYLFSTGYGAYVASMPATVTDETATLKSFLGKSATFFDILANYEISGFIGLVLLNTWMSKPPTDMASATLYYQNIKVVYAFWTWQYFLIMKDYYELFPEAYAKVDPKFKKFVTVMEMYSCWFAFNEWHVATMMDVAALEDPSTDLGKATLAGIFWNEAFIKTVKMLVGMKMWSASYPDQAWLTKMPPFIALSLPYIAFTQSYWEGEIAVLKEKASKAAAVKAKA